MRRRVSGMAVVLALLASGCDKTLPKDRNIRWHQADVLSIEMNADADAWHAGHVNDILKLEPESGMLIASEAGGVWAISRIAQAIPLSDTWASNSILALAFGPDGPRHVYAGSWPNRRVDGRVQVETSEGGVLMETDTSTASPTLNWRRVNPKPPCGSINRILVINEARRIVLACDTGLYWSQIPPAPSAQGTYTWNDATPATVQEGRAFSSLAKGPGWSDGREGTIVAAKWGGAAPIAAIYSGGWSGGKLSVGVSNVDQGSGNFQLFLGRTSIAACPADPRTMFAVAATQVSKTMVGIWKSTDGGQRWVMVPMPPDPGAQGDYNNAIAVSSDCRIVAVGWQNGTFVSYDGGGSWNLLSGGSHLHADVHALTFDPADPATLYIGSDGGVASANSLAPGGSPTFASNWNRQLFNLQIDHAAGSPAANGFVAGGLQDNGVVYAGLPGPWQHVTNCACDGRWSVFLTPPDIGAGNSILLEEEWGAPDWPFSSVQANATNIPFNTQQGIPLSPPSTAVLTNVVTVPIRSPGGYSNASGQTLFAIGGTGTSLYGMFANDDGSNLHWEPLGRIGGGQNVTALAPTYNGQSMFVGTDAGNIFRLDAPFTGWLQLGVNLPAGAKGDRSISGLVAFFSTIAYATMNIGGSGYVMSLDGTTGVWNSVGSNLPHNLPFNSIAAADLRSIFVSTSARVYDTHDGGSTWNQASDGLPSNITVRNELHVVTEPSGTTYLYLATYGRSLWRTRLP